MGWLRSWLVDVEALEQVIADPDRVRHRGERRVDRADAREEARVDHVQVVELVRAAVGVQDRGGGIGAESAGARLMGTSGHRDLVLEVGVMRQQVVVVHAEVREHLLELVEQALFRLFVAGLVLDHDVAVARERDPVLGRGQVFGGEPEVDGVAGDVFERPVGSEPGLTGFFAAEHRRL